MKELSIEGKATRYDQAIKVAKSKIKNDKDHVLYEDDVIEMFPELKEESEDERIRKELIALIKECLVPPTLFRFGLNKEDTIAWLEKQGEQPKKHDVCDNCDQQGCCVSPCPMKLVEKQAEQKQELLTKEKALKNSPFVEQKPAWSEEDELHIRELESLVKQVWVIAEYENDKDTIHKMSDLSFFLKTLKPQLKQDWSEEDKRTIDNLVSQLGNLFARKLIKEETKDKYVNWLKSLKERYTWKPSDEQMEALANALSLAKNCGEENAFDLRTLYEQLKKLREE